MNKQIGIRIDERIINIFKKESEDIGIKYTELIRSCLFKEAKMIEERLK